MDNSMDSSYLPELDPDHEHAASWRAWNTLQQFLHDDEWKPERINDHPAFRVFYQGTNVHLRCVAQIKLETQQLVIYAYYPIHVGQEQRMAAAEYLTRANYGLNVANFEFDFNDGEVRCKCSLDFEDETLSYPWVRNTIYPATRIADRYFPGLMKVIYGSATPEEAIKEIES